MSHKKKLKFEKIIKTVLKPLNLILKKYLENNKINIDSLKNNNKELRGNNKSILKTQQSFESGRHNVFSEEINKIALSSYDDKRMQSIDSIETYANRTSKDLVSEIEVNKCSYIIQQYKND